MISELLKYPDLRLKKKSLPITEITPEIKELAAQMTVVMHAEKGVGLAAPQMGIFVRMVVICVPLDETEDAERVEYVLINPQIEVLDDDLYCEEEGCLSVPDFRSVVERHAKIRVKALDLNGQPLQFEAEDLLAICAQHECDHLDGILFVDRISRLKKNIYDKRLKKLKAEKNN